MSTGVAQAESRPLPPPPRKRRRKRDDAPEVPKYWTVRQLMEHLDCTRSAIDAQVRKGNLRLRKLGHWSLIHETEVRRFLRKVLVARHNNRVILLYEG